MKTSVISPPQQNIQLAWTVLKDLSEIGVQEFCVCPGARNAPWVAMLAENPKHFRCFYFFEERSAAFFALGRIRLTGRPVGVITTSGTAAGELLPATMEGYYTGSPLILLTADRPPRYRGSGAPQAAEQVGIFGSYVSQSRDMAWGETMSTGLKDQPLDRPFHLNVCFEEPLLDPSSSLKWEHLAERGFPRELKSERPVPSTPTVLEVQTEIRKFLSQVRFPVAVVGALPSSAREVVSKLLQEWGIPSYFEGLSGLREDSSLAFQRIHSADGWMADGLRADYPIDGVLRIGGVPTLRFWRDLDSSLSELPVLSVSSLPFSGLGRPSSVLVGTVAEDFERICKNIHEIILGGNHGEMAPARDRFLSLDREKEWHLRQCLTEEPRSEPAIFASLSERIPRGSRLYLGNSLPIREWDLAATRENRGYDVWASRGLNGIDGQVSTFLGFAEEGKENWAILGDLTTLYDLPGPWILPQLPHVSINLVVINNQGGQIFSRMFPYSEFQNKHQVSFRSWAEMWGMSYEVWTEIPKEVESKSMGQHRLIEILPDDASTRRFWSKT